MYGLDPDFDSAPLPDLDAWLAACAREAVLLDLARSSLDELFRMLGDADCAAFVSDRDGLVLDFRSNRAVDVWGCPPKDWYGTVPTEKLVGTNGVGTCIAEQRAAAIRGDENVLTRFTTCASIVAPLFGPDGALAGTFGLTQSSKAHDARLDAFPWSSWSLSARRMETEEEIPAMTVDAAEAKAGTAAFPPAAAALPQVSRVRWWQLSLGILCMAMIANLQYGWTLFVDPIGKANHWDRASVQLAFTLFVLTETWLVPVKSWFVDRYGPRPVVILGAALITVAWVLNSIAASLPMLYLGAAVGGFGAAAIYGTCVGNALKWFPDKRGLAAGATAAGFGAGAALTIVPISHVIASDGYRRAFLVFGLGQGLVVLVASLFLHAPEILHPAKLPRLRIPQSKRNFKPATMVRQPVFWLLYLCFVMVAAGGLMTAAQIAPIAADYGITKSPVVLAGLTFGALTLALSLDRILDGLGRPLFGLLADRIGRENTMGIAFSFAALMLLLLGTQGREPFVFVFASACYFLVFGEIYSLFPATCGDTFGPKFAATNAGILYTAKGTAALLVPLASVISRDYGWRPVFLITVALNVGAALIALLIVKPLRMRFIDDTAIMR